MTWNDTPSHNAESMKSTDTVRLHYSLLVIADRGHDNSADVDERVRSCDNAGNGLLLVKLTADKRYIA